MANEQINRYIEQCLKLGKTKEDIIKMLLSGGWTNEQIKGSFKFIKNNKKSAEIKLVTTEELKSEQIAEKNTTNVFHASQIRKNSEKENKKSSILGIIFNVIKILATVLAIISLFFSAKGISNSIFITDYSYVIYFFIFGSFFYLLFYFSIRDLSLIKKVTKIVVNIFFILSLIAMCCFGIISFIYTKSLQADLDTSGWGGLLMLGMIGSFIYSGFIVLFLALQQIIMLIIDKKSRNLMVILIIIILCNSVGFYFVNKNNVTKEYNNSSTQTLLWSVRDGRLEGVQKAIKNGADVNAKDSSYGEQTALMQAAGKGNLDIVKELINAGANVNAVYGSTALMEASRNGYLDIVKELIKVGADVNAESGSAVIVAASNGHLDIVKELIKTGADVNANHDDVYGSTALMEASRNGYLDIVKELISAGADVNFNQKNPKYVVYGSTALMQAAVNELVGAGADVNAIDYNHKTVLMYASNNGNVDIVKELISAGADANAKDSKNRTALIWTSENSQGSHDQRFTDIVRELIRAGAKE